MSRGDVMGWKELTLVLQDKASQALTERDATELLVSGMPTSISQSEMLKLGRKLGTYPQTPTVTLHHFGDRVYVREFRQPAYSIVVGQIHRYDHVFMIISGEVTVISPDGRERLNAPYIKTSRGGIERVVIAHTDVTFLTAHPNPGNLGLDALEAVLFMHPEDVIEAS